MSHVSDRVAVRILAGMLSNGVILNPGDHFPFGWDASGQREYALASVVLIQDARSSLRTH